MPEDIDPIETAKDASARIQAREYTRICDLFARTPWAILPEKFAQICELLEIRSRGEYVTAEQITAAIASGRRDNSGLVRQDSIAVLPLHGTIFQRASLFTQFSGGVSTEQFGAQLDELMGDDSVKAIVIDVDSPGGSTMGVPELASKLASLRGQKRIVAVANSTMASAAYWIGSAAGEVVATPSALVGSIGVLIQHVDNSKAIEWSGRKVTMITAGKFKGDGNPYSPLSDSAREGLQALCDDYYKLFVSAVAHQRGVTADEVKNGFGQGRVVLAQEAVRQGMVDRVETLEQTLQRLSVETGARQIVGASAHSVKLLEREVEALSK